MNISLGETFTRYIEQQLEGGRYNNASEVVREALRLKMQKEEQYEAELMALRAEIQIGLDQAARGEVVETTVDELRKRFKVDQKPCDSF